MSQQLAMAPPKPRTPKRKILDEDTYLACLEHIIKRDFFPSSTRDQDARQLVQPGTPASSIFAPPSPSPSSVSSSFSTRTRTVPKLEMSLDNFLAQYTSEDNASFDKLLEKSNQQKRARFAWLFEAQQKHNKYLLEHLPPSLNQSQIQNTTQHLAITSGDTQGTPAPPNTTNKNETKLDETPSTNSSSTTDNRAILGCKYTVQNALMYGPQDQLSYKPEEVTGGAPRQINHNNTRIFSKKTSNRMLGTPLQNPSASPAIGASPQGAGYRMLMTPSPVPSRSAAQSPFMTWGDIGTPLRLEEEDVGMRGPAFMIAEPSSREQHAMRLSSNAQSKRRKHEASNEPRFSGALSPAGQKLLAKTLKSPLIRLASLHPSTANADPQLRRSYSKQASNYISSSSSSMSSRGSLPPTPSSSSAPHTPLTSPAHAKQCFTETTHAT
eukprot:c14844_g1_i1.p1 GENE.c14844_g1_i1~~c14844_g1_i1.p1  ORF type:complete len:456 (+),score=95.91 c14844_g1_i1:56-1369(+)